ncbi:MAG: pyruvate, phosphate dikinase [Gemmatimonadota bacterium]
MKQVYSFGDGHADGHRGLTDLLGGKGSNIAEMTRLGVPVPPGFTLTTDVCRHHLISSELPDGLHDDVVGALRQVEALTGRSFGSPDDPLLVSVRSGAAISMPGMMDTILNVGLNDHTVEGLARASADERFAYDSYRRFVQMYGKVVLGVSHSDFEAILSEEKLQAGADEDHELGVVHLRQIIRRYRDLVTQKGSAPFPDDPVAQLWGAIEAVFRSWRNPRARAYRKEYGIPHDLGTGVTVQAMVFGNRGAGSGTGVAFTRNASTGEPVLFGEFLVNAQGEDVVAGIRDPLSIDQMQDHLPQAYEQLVETATRLEKHYGDMQDLEFTVEDGRLFLLQTRTGKRTAQAAVRIAVDLAGEGLIDRRTAVLRVAPQRIEQVLHSAVDPEAEYEPIAVGIPASPGAASGRLVLTSDEAISAAADGEAVILVRRETSPDDFEGMVAAQAIVTTRGGKTSHAAVVARGMGKCCVVGTRDLSIDEKAGEIRCNGNVLRRGDALTVDGASGEVIAGIVPTVKYEPGEYFDTLMDWADEFRVLGVRANADTPEDALRGRQFGAAGIGLCRTEHMFAGEERIDAVRMMIMARDDESRSRALDRLLPMQRGDFEGIFRAMDGLPVTIRLLDPPLHEFLPDEVEELERMARVLDISRDDVDQRVSTLEEANPMLGHRGCRLGYSLPEITAMQARAIFEAAVAVQEDGVTVLPEVMVPLVSTAAELAQQAEVVHRVAAEVFAASSQRVSYLVGTMIELPRACLTAGEIAECADFFSFGTNDLTQTAFGLSRDDAGSFLSLYVENGVYEADPFQTIDRAGVGRLMRIAVAEGKARKESLKIGICGEHGGDPDSVEYCHWLGLDYVSCSPFRVPVARLAAAHAALAGPEGERTKAEAEDAPDPPTGSDPIQTAGAAF